MAKTKQRSGSVAQRREQARKQRDERLNTEKSYPRARGRRTKHRESNPWPLVIGIVLMSAVVIGVFIWLANQPRGGSPANALTTIQKPDQNLLQTVGKGSATSSFKAIPAGATIPKGPTGKPQFLYMGANYCPYCAAQRWSIITALSRFGSFSPLESLFSGEANVPTFTFHNVKYTSSYIDFVAVETSDNDGKALDTPTAEQTKLIQTYDAPPYTTADSKGSIPFVVVGDKLVANGSFYSPQLLVGLSYDDIANKIKDTNSDVSKGMLGAANYITAAVCQITNNQPTNVCNSDFIRSIQNSLPKAATSNTTPQFASTGALPDMLIRRPD